MIDVVDLAPGRLYQADRPLEYRALLLRRPLGLVPGPLLLGGQVRRGSWLPAPSISLEPGLETVDALPGMYLVFFEGGQALPSNSSRRSSPTGISISAGPREKGGGHQDANGRRAQHEHEPAAYWRDDSPATMLSTCATNSATRWIWLDTLPSPGKLSDQLPSADCVSANQSPMRTVQSRYCGSPVTW